MRGSRRSHFCSSFQISGSHQRRSPLTDVMHNVKFIGAFWRRASVTSLSGRRRPRSLIGGKQMARRFVVRMLLLFVASLVLMPAAARAQSVFTGTVKDTSGAVMPGVTVEADS